MGAKKKTHEAVVDAIRLARASDRHAVAVARIAGLCDASLVVNGKTRNRRTC